VTSATNLVFAALLLLVTLVWGWTFPVVKDAVAAYGVVAFLAIRFALATVAMAPLGIRRATRASWLAGGGIGLALAAGYVFQTFGIKYTTATNSGLITGLFVISAPVWNRVLFGVRADRIFVGTAIASLCGLALLTGTGLADPAIGDLVTLGCALSFGLHIALLDRYSRRHDTSALALSQMAVAAVVFAAVWPLTEPLVLPATPMVWHALLLTGIVASAGGFWVQTATQRRLPATRVAMLLTMEPVFATIFGRLLAGDRLTILQMIGGALMVAAMLVCNIHQAANSRTQSMSEAGVRERPE
jgi:drug/metabolite transporter (DMT)-like permease